MEAALTASPPSLALIDCISPTVANFFYLVVSLCFVIVATASFAAVLHFLAPPFGFFVWLKANNALELCNCERAPYLTPPLQVA